MNDAFISYSSKEYDEAKHLREVLTKNGISCWMAPDSIEPGSNYAKVIPGAIDNCKVFVLVLSQLSQSSIWVSREVDLAVNKNKIIIPFMLDESLNEEFNFYLIGSQRILAYEKKAEAFEQLIKRCKAIIDADSTPDKTNTVSEKGKTEASVSQDDAFTAECAAAPKEKAPISKPDACNGEQVDGTAAQGACSGQNTDRGQKENSVPNGFVGENPYVGAVKKFVASNIDVFNSRSTLFKAYIARVQKNFPIPSQYEVFLAHDDTLLASGKNGFAWCSQGIYVKELMSKPTLVPWSDFINASEDDICLYRANEDNKSKISDTNSYISSGIYLHIGSEYKCIAYVTNREYNKLAFKIYKELLKYLKANTALQ